jgi:beta-N-acetylhexosaminidase
MHSFAGYKVPPEILKAVKEGKISSFCLFAGKNVESPTQLRELTDALRRAAEEGGHPAPLIGIDQEGGQLIAVTGGATELPGNMALGATRSTELAEKAGYVLGRELLAMGISLNFAPSVDVNVNPANPVIL